MRPVKALTKEQAVDLLPDEFRPADIVPGAKQLIRTPKGLMAFHRSSLIKDGFWKTSHSRKEVSTEIDFVLFALGNEGILILPKDMLLTFFDDKVNGKYSGDRYKINVRKEGERFVWQGRSGNRLDVSEYFRGVWP